MFSEKSEPELTLGYERVLCYEALLDLRNNDLIVLLNRRVEHIEKLIDVDDRIGEYNLEKCFVKLFIV